LNVDLLVREICPESLELLRRADKDAKVLVTVRHHAVGPLSDADIGRGSDRNGEPIRESQRLHFAPAEHPSVELQ